MTETRDESRIGKRPIPITIVCILGFLGYASIPSIILFGIRHSIIQQYNVIAILNMALSIILGLFGYIGYWKMRKWGIYCFATMLINNICFSSIHNLKIGNVGYLIQIVTIGVGLSYFKRMK